MERTGRVPRVSTRLAGSVTVGLSKCCRGLNAEALHLLRPLSGGAGNCTCRKPRPNSKEVNKMAAPVVEKVGVTVDRRFTEEGVHPFNMVEWEVRDAVIG